MAETFYEGDVKLQVRLDELQRQLDQSEALILQSERRVQQQRTRAIQQVQQVEREASDGGGLVDGALTAVDAYTLLDRKLRLVKIGIGGIRVAGVLLTRVLAPAAIASGVLALGNATRSAERGLRDIVQAARQLDGSAESAQALRDELADIPIAGRAVVSVMNLFRRPAETLGRLVTTAKDGRIELNFLGRTVDTIQRTANGATSMLLGRLSRFLPAIQPIGRELDRLNAGIAETQRNIAALQFSGQVDAQFVDPLRGMADQVRRQAQLQGAASVERAELQGQFSAEDVNQRTLAAVRQINEEFNERAASIREEYVGLERVAELERNRTERNRRVNQAYEQQASALQAIRQITEGNVDAAQAELEAQRQITRERKIQEGGQSIIEIQGLRAAADAAEAEAGGRGFDAQRIQIENQRSQELFRAQGDIERREINRRFDARLEAIERREQEETARQAELREQRLDQELQDELTRQQRLDRVALETRRQRQINEGDTEGAERTAIRQDLQPQIEQALAAGNDRLATLLQGLLETRLEGVGRDEEVQQQRFAQAQQISASRFAAGPDASRQIDLSQRQLEVQEQIAKNTRPRNNFAVLG